MFNVVVRRREGLDGRIRVTADITSVRHDVGSGSWSGSNSKSIVGKTASTASSSTKYPVNNILVSSAVRGERTENRIQLTRLVSRILKTFGNPGGAQIVWEVVDVDDSGPWRNGYPRLLHSSGLSRLFAVELG